MTLSTVPTNGGSAFLEGNSETLTNTNNVIQGTGIIGNGSLALINQHVIDATPEGGTSTLTLNGSGGITNSATMEATAGGVLVIDNTVDNAGGNITVVGTSTVELLNATVQGGTLNNASGGTLETVSSAELDGSTQGALTISTGSTYTATDGTTTYLLGSIVEQGPDPAEWRERPEQHPGHLDVGDAQRRRDRDDEHGPDQWRQRVHPGQRRDPDQYRQHDPGHRDHRQRQPGADQSSTSSMRRPRAAPSR